MFRLGFIKIQIDHVKTSNSELKKTANKLSETALELSSLKNRIDKKILARSNIESRLNNTNNSINKLEKDLKQLESFIETSMNKYSRTENKIVHHASSLGCEKMDVSSGDSLKHDAPLSNPSKKDLSSRLNDIFGYFDSIKNAIGIGDKILLGSLGLTAATAIGSSRGLKINYSNGRPTLVQRIRGGYKFTVQAPVSWTSKGNYSNPIARLISNFSKSTPTNPFSKAIHKMVSSYQNPPALLKHLAGFPKNVNGPMKAATLKERIYTRATFNTTKAAEAFLKGKGWTGVGKRIPVVGNIISLGANLTEFTEPANVNKTPAEKIGRFAAGTVTDAVAIGAGAKVGAAIGSVGGPVGIIVGGAVGGLVGGVASSVAGDAIKDAGEKIASGIEKGVSQRPTT